MKITFMGAGSTVFARNVLGDVMCTPALRGAELALYDIDAKRAQESGLILAAINHNVNESRARIKTYVGTENRREALRGADFVVNAIQVGGYEPCTVIDFEIPKKYGLRQTIADTLGIGGIMRALRTIPVLEDFAEDMRAVCPKAWFLNYVNPMAMLSGYMQRYAGIKTVGLCHSVQCCSGELLDALHMQDKKEGRRELIAGINHQGWLLELYDREGNDLYPEIRRRAAEKNTGEKHGDMVRYEYIRRLGYYCTESSEHNAEYNPWFIKARRPDLVEKFNIPLDEYLRRCVAQIKGWEKERDDILADGKITHARGGEYASHIMEAIATGVPYKFGGNVLNEGLIDNLPREACVEVPCLADGYGVLPCHVGALPPQLAALNTTNILAQLLTIEAARTRSKEAIYHAAMLEPRCAGELALDEIVAMCDELIEAHGGYMAMYR
ncbi:MAG: alpha-glucosidase/alpha-galactosidase [Oscillospiraceae bacterium]|jgi:alpha-galactosidase|nr:alpha-glucosidase/alpha-galactosidase [Oscillospiraceae bacterium]